MLGGSILTELGPYVHHYMVHFMAELCASFLDSNMIMWHLFRLHSSSDIWTCT